MAGIKTKIAITDNASPVLTKISKNLGKCISGFMRLNSVSQQAINVSSFSPASGVLDEINSNVQEINRNLQQTPESANDLTESLDRASNKSNELMTAIKRTAAAYLTLRSADKILDTSDELAMAKQRLGLTLREGEVVEDLNKKIMASANDARASYTDTLNQVSKLAMNAGKSFENTDQITKFVEEFNKLGTLGGASVYESSQAMYQLTQSMAKGKLDGDELRSVMEGMPLVTQEIAKYLDTDVGTMKEMAAEGKVTAEVVKNALLGAAEETDEKFNTMPYTFAQLGQLFKNNAISAFQPVLIKLNELANNEKFQGFIDSAVNGMYFLGNVVSVILTGIGEVGSFIYDNWSIIEPVIAGVAAALLIYNGYMIAHNVILGISNGIKALSVTLAVAHGTMTAAEAAATTGMTAAQVGLNAAFLACPLTWIMLVIIAVIALIYAAVAAINKVTGSTISATGVICGAIATAGAFIFNTVIGILNGILQLLWTIFVDPFIGIIEFVLNASNGGFNSFGGAVANLIGQMISWFLSLGKVVTKIIDAIFGTDWTSGLNDLQNTVTAWGKNDNAISISREAPSLSGLGVDRIKYGDAYNSGYKFGEGIDDKLENAFKIPEAGDLGLNYDPNGSIANSLGNIDDNTASTAKSVDISNEDLKYLRDVAEQEAINRFTTAEIKVDMTNNNNIGSNMDIDGIVDHLATRINEAMTVAAEGAY